MNNEDRELLEMAAGYKTDWWQDSQAPGAYFLQVGRRSAEWNPLTNDGDALRLAVKLRLFLQHEFKIDVAKASLDPEDPYAATRRAIVRASAEIGKTLK